MSDLEKRLNQIEQKIDAVAHAPSPYYGGGIQQNRSDEIDLRELWNVLWTGKWWIIGITFLFAVAGVLYALSLPNMYKSEGVYVPAQNDGGVSGLSGQYGGLAAIAGINLGGGGSNDIDQAVALIKSWPFLEKFVQENNLEAYVFAVKGWNKATRELIWDTEVYDENNDVWLNSDDGESLFPTSYDIYKVLSQFVNVVNDTKTSMVTISITHYSPEIAANWVNLLVKAVNEHFQRRDTVETKRNVAYLERKILETSVAEMQSVFYGMIETQTQTLMLAEVSDEYLLKEVIPPKIAEQKSKPAKAVICILFVMFGGVFAGVIVLIRGFLLKDISK